MHYAKYQADFAAIYPNYGAPPLMEKLRFSRKRVTIIAYHLKIRRLPRDSRICWSCPNPMRGLPSYTGNYCLDCFHARRKKQEEAPEQFLRTLFHRAKNRAGKKGIEFNLTQEHLLDLWKQQKQRCFYSNMEMKTDGRQRDPYGMSLDRVRPEKGYTIGNVVLCCWGVNTAKQEFTLAEFIGLCRNVASHLQLDVSIKSFDGVGQGKSLMDLTG